MTDKTIIKSTVQCASKASKSKTISEKVKEVFKSTIKPSQEVSLSYGKFGLKAKTKGAIETIPKTGLKTTLYVGGPAVALCLLYQFGKEQIKKHFQKTDDSAKESAKDSKDDKAAEDTEPRNESADDIRLRAMSKADKGFYHELIGMLLAAGDRCILYGAPGTGKTVVAIQMARDIACGKSSKLVPDTSTDVASLKPQKVVYYDAELDDDDFMNIFGASDLTSLKNLTFRRNFNFKNREEWVKDVKKVAANTQSDLCIFLDNLSGINTSISVNETRELILHDMKRLQKEHENRGYTLTFVIIAHTTKGGELAGSSNLKNFATAVMGLSKIENDNKHIRLTVDKCRKHGEKQGLKFTLEKKEDDDGYKYDEYVPDTSPSTNGGGGQGTGASSTDPNTIISGAITLAMARQMRSDYIPNVFGYGKVGAKYGFGSTQVSRAIDKLNEIEPLSNTDSTTLTN